MSPPLTPGGDVASTMADLIAPILQAPEVQLALRLGAWTLLVTWGLAIIWVVRDASRRSPHPLVAVLATGGMVLATPLGSVPALLVWLLVRPRCTVTESREQRLSIAALESSLRGPVCVGCGHASDPGWQRCPHCRLWLQAPCPRCERPVELGASVCPWCVTDLPTGALRPRVDTPAVTPAVKRQPARPKTPALEPAGRVKAAMRVAGAPRS